MKTIKTDLAIMGSGLAGLAAGYRAIRNTNLKVAVFEKRPFQGGAVSNCPMGIVSVPDKQEHLQQALRVTGEWTNYAGDLGVARTWYSYSSLLPKILFDELGIQIEEHIERDPKTYGTQRGYGIGFPNGEDVGDIYFIKGSGQGHGGALACLRMRWAIEQAGGKTHFSTPIYKIIRDENGRVTGAVAKAPDGEDIQIECKALIVASGGFSENPEMLKDELGYTYTDRCRSNGGDVFFIHFPNSKLTGDGQKAVWEIGGRKGGMAVTGHSVVPWPGAVGENVPWLMKNQTRVMQEQPYLWVNDFGERFMNEELTNQHMGVSACLDRQPRNCGYLIFDEDTVKHWAQNGVEDGFVYFIFRGMKIVDVRGQFDKMIAEGSTHVAHADSIAEICEKMGIDETGLRKTLAHYNKYCEDGEDREFGKNPKYLRPVREESGHIYAMRIGLSGYMTMGGVSVNRRCEVLDNAMQPIPGLYSAGDIMSGSLYGDPPICASSTMSQAMSTGMAAADNANRYIQKLNKNLDGAETVVAADDSAPPLTHRVVEALHPCGWRERAAQAKAQESGPYNDGKMRLQIKDYCIRCGICIDLYPELFERNWKEDSIRIKHDMIPEHLEQQAKDAIRDCAVTAIYMDAGKNV